MLQNKLYSTLTAQELHEEIARQQEKAQKAEQMGMMSELAVLERKVVMAKSYLLDSELFVPGKIYEIENDPGSYFKIDYLNGVFAWGYRLNGNGKETALPIAMLKP